MSQISVRRCVPRFELLAAAGVLAVLSPGVWAESLPGTAGRVAAFSYSEMSSLPEDEASGGERPVSRFGDPGYQAITMGAGFAYGGSRSDGTYNSFISYDTFLAEEFQFGIELSGWFFNQEEADATGGAINFEFLWHFMMDEEDRDWSLFAELGVGMYVATDEVPNGGSEFGFTPRAGVGFTHRLFDTRNRVVAGIRWQHFSNARLVGADRNPGTDMAMLYAGISIPF